MPPPPPPAVSALMVTADPVTKAGLAALTCLHDRCVASAAYRRVLSCTASTLAWLHASRPYQLVSFYVSPYVQPYTDPALANLSKSAYVSKMVKYWTPVAVVAA